MNPLIPHQKEENDTRHASKIILHLSAWPNYQLSLKVKCHYTSFFNFVQSITQHHKRRTLHEGPLQSIQSQWKTLTIPVT